MRTRALSLGLVLLSLSPLAALADDEPSPAAPTAPADTALLEISLDKTKVDLKAHRLELVLSRDAAKVSVHVVGDSGAVLADSELDFSGKAAGTPLVVTWTPSSEENVARIELKAWDTRGYWAGIAVIPWSVFIPHQDVNFKTGSAKIEDSERPKLEESYAKIAEAIAKHADIGAITLFVVGHTDTVGKAKDNFKLSEQRARAIAAWFQQRGVTLPIAFEGFGESAPLVKTRDEVAEPKNRRVDYILALDEPAIRAVDFKPAWKKLR